MFKEMEKTDAIRLLLRSGGVAGIMDAQSPMEWGRDCDIAVGKSGPHELSILFGGSINSSIEGNSWRTAREHVAQVRTTASSLVDQQMVESGVENAAVEAAAAELDKGRAAAAELAGRIQSAKAAFDAALNDCRDPRPEGAILASVEQEASSVNAWIERLQIKFNEAVATLKIKRASFWKTAITDAFTEQMKAVTQRRQALQARVEEIAVELSQELTLLHALESVLKS